MVRVGLAPEGRTYLPHITLARLPRSMGLGVEIERWCADHAGLTSAPFAIGHLYLYASTLGSGGARYEAIERWPLGCGASPAGFELGCDLSLSQRGEGRRAQRSRERVQ
jgi:2'-5' RNA ligase